jgi:hypothetical protein
MDMESPSDASVSLPTFENGPDLRYDPLTDDMNLVLHNAGEDEEHCDFDARFDTDSIDELTLANLESHPQGSFHSLSILNYLAMTRDELFPTHIDASLGTYETKANILEALEGMWQMWETDPTILRKVRMTVLVEDRLDCSYSTDSRAPLYECRSELNLALKLMGSDRGLEHKVSLFTTSRAFDGGVAC